ncbi:serine/threonine protein kinase [Polyangium jinanense]|uniref:serine/threonine-protein kinase n=1 Tax=Polyangium jinanense TaxID=2829994 RepID=UPI002341650A|nr:serine/threonine-protein kinase [Polyangium jinanense]MDC3959619.1 serine/threonine protein kinase [Polyangium jinanense]
MVTTPFEPEVHSERTAHLLTFSPGIVIAGKFALQRMIASGSMGTVFEARDTFVERNVAVKLMHPHLASDPQLVARFRREAQAAARIQHPNVVTVLEVGKRRDGTFYIVHELLTGRTLRHVLETNPRRAVGEVLSIALPLMGGLAAAHACGIVHRDIKPENIILSVTPSGELVPKIVDFGIAKMSQESSRKGLTHFGMIMGTPHYMAPEQAIGGAVDMRTDIWAMGVLLFEMLAGVPPFDGESPEEVLRKVVAEKPPRLASLAPEAAPFAEVIHRALAKNAADRPPTIEIFTEALLDASQGRHRPLFVSAIETTDQITLRISPNLPPLSALEREAALPPVVEEEPEPPTLRLSMTALEAPTAQARASLGQSEMEWRAADTITVPYEADRAAEAERSLSVNALRDAIERARMAMSARGVSDDLCARMSLVQAIAQCWLGEYESAANAAHQAFEHFERGTTGWHAALGHMVIANGHLGRKTVMSVSAKELMELDQRDGVTNPAHLVSYCRLVVFAVRLGQVRLAERLLERALRHAVRPGDVGPFVAAWLDVARGELSLHRGDLTAYLQRVQSAAELFTSASDIRNSCLQRSNVGNALLQLGAYEQAVVALTESIGVAEPMQLALVATAKANLGLALSYVGGLDDGIARANEALGQFRRQRNVRGEAITLVYLSRMHVVLKRLGEAASMAEDAARLAEGIPGVRAYALAMQASIELANRRAPEALDRAGEAMEILEGLSGVEEGESLIRLVHAASLRAAGRKADAKRRIDEAQAGLLAKADRIGDERWRSVFLRNEPDNAQLMSLAKKLLGS